MKTEIVSTQQYGTRLVDGQQEVGHNNKTVRRMITPSSVKTGIAIDDKTKIFHDLSSRYILASINLQNEKERFRSQKDVFVNDAVAVCDGVCDGIVCDQICDGITCDSVVCDKVCDTVCDSIVCDSVCDVVIGCDSVMCDSVVCDVICDQVCDQICDQICDAVNKVA